MSDTTFIPVGDSGSKLNSLCDKVIHWTVYVLAAAVPLFFLPWTIEVLELNKQLLIIAGAAISGMAWLGKMLVARRFEYRRSIVNVFVALFTISYAASAWFSESRYLSMMGDFGQEKAGFVTVLAFVIIYFVITANFHEISELRKMLLSIIIGGFVTAVFAILQGVGVFILPFEFAKSASFNTVGTAASLGTYLAFVTTLCGGLLLADHGAAHRNRIMAMVTNGVIIVTGVVSLLLICVIDYWPVTVSLLVSSALLIAFAFVHAKAVRGIGGILLPVAGIVVAAMLLLFRFPVSLGFPSEVMPSFKASTDIVVKTLREKPFLGSGPGTFIFDYAKHRAQEVNGSQFWNIRFDRGSSRILTSLATTGLVGTLSWALVALFLAFSSGKKLFRTDEETWHLLIGIFAAWSSLLVARFVYSSTITLEFAFWMMMAALVVSNRKDFFSVRLEESPRAAMSVSFLFILGLVFALSGLFVEGTRYAAEIAYAQAIRTSNANGSADEVVSSLTRAVNLNSRNDVYLRNLALAYLAKADRLLAETPAVEAQKKDETKTAYDKRVAEAQQLQIRQVSEYTAAAVNTAKVATDRAGNNVANWSVLASIYQGLMGVTEGADGWAVSSYEKAIALEPANPSLYTELGKVYIYESDVARQLIDTSKDEQAKGNAKTKSEESVVKAVDAFNKAIELKSDFAVAHYNLALALDRQGKLKDAIEKMKRVAVISPQDIGVPFQLSLLYYRDGRKDDAVALLEAIVQRTPTFSNARWYLASMYEEKGDFDKAIAQIDEVAKLNPENELVKQKQTELATKKAAGSEGLPQPVDQPVVNQNEPGVRQ